ncbi:MAG: amino acid ABC transporter permease [Clostridia bacterium]|nr:amino acid ABC transporter permease [Clostridia bacterium]
MPSTKIKLAVDGTLLSLFENSAIIESHIDLEIYQTDAGYVLYTSDATIDALYGGLASAVDEVIALDTVTINGVEIKAETNLKKGLTECVSITYEDSKPDTSVPIIKKWNDIKKEFHRNFIEDARWHYITDGLWITAKITFFAVIIGIVLGFFCAIVRCTHDKIGKLKLLNGIVKLYLTVIRGTPVLVQLMIIFFVIFMPLGIDKMPAAILCFGLNSGAYVAEIVRGGIMSIDNGQFEAGRSLGFGYVRTMWHIVIPQAFKSVLPALANEFIVLLKETSVASYIGINDLTRGGDIIRGVTYSAFMPLIIVALIYLVLVVGLSYLVSLLERRLRKSDRS